MAWSSNKLHFTYDSIGPASVTYNGVKYFYLKNAQGDVTGLVNASGTQVVSYTYDPWGAPMSVSGSMSATLGAVNPLRYRGYVYDTETGLYYLSSRYYNPVWGRFINADSYASTGQGFTSDNMFAYCNDNPVMLFDPTGCAAVWWQWVISGGMVIAGTALIATGIGGVAGGALICAGANSIIGSYASEASGGTSLAGWTGGMITGGICGIGAGLAGGLLLNASASVGTGCIGNLMGAGAIAFSSGAGGTVVGQSITAAIDGRHLSIEKVLTSSIMAGVINCFSVIAAGMGAAMQSMPLISTTSTVLANSMTAAWSLSSESSCDLLGMIPVRQLR